MDKIKHTQRDMFSIPLDCIFAMNRLPQVSARSFWSDIGKFLIKPTWSHWRNTQPHSRLNNWLAIGKHVNISAFWFTYSLLFLEAILFISDDHVNHTGGYQTMRFESFINFSCSLISTLLTLWWEFVFAYMHVVVWRNKIPMRKSYEFQAFN